LYAAKSPIVNVVINEIGDGKVIKFNRVWTMPNGDTLQMEPVLNFVKSYIQPNIIIIDPFARDCMLATYRNDLNPDTKAEFHMEVMDFLRMLGNKNISADLIIFDPPYSSRQMSELYKSVGMEFGINGGQRFGWKEERNLLNNLVKVGGIVISFGWNSIGMGIKRLYKLEEILLVCHGGAHNDTICIAERKTAHQERLEI